MSLSRRSSSVVWLFLCLVSGSPAVHADNAIVEYKSIQQKLRSARTNHDWSASLTSANDLSQRLNGAPNSLLELARAKLHTNDFAGAVRDLQRFAHMGQSTDLLAASPEFAPLGRQPELESSLPR
jgi:hypothetical protein